MEEESQSEAQGQQWVAQSLELTSGENLKELPPPLSPAALAPDPGFMQVLILGPCHPREKDKGGRLRVSPPPTHTHTGRGENKNWPVGIWSLKHETRTISLHCWLTHWLRALSSTWAEGELPEDQREDWCQSLPIYRQDKGLQPSLNPLLTELHFISGWGSSVWRPCVSICLLNHMWW